MKKQGAGAENSWDEPVLDDDAQGNALSPSFEYKLFH